MPGKLKKTAENIRVVCRVRPLNTDERNRSKFAVVFLGDDEQNALQVMDSRYTFDRVFRPESTQEDVYNGAAKTVVEDILNGFNGTIFAYGQTASGKTYTMEGVVGDQKMQGIIPRIADDIFDHIRKMNEKAEVKIIVSYVEIYMEKVFDLLSSNTVQLRVAGSGNTLSLVGLTQKPVQNIRTVFKLLKNGGTRRHVAETLMSAHSSRSHAVFSINVEQAYKSSNKTVSSKLSLVDLAGSERTSKSGAEGQTAQEAIRINQSLSTLGRVIWELTRKRPNHIPYRDSVLTRFLQNSLGGNARTTIILCCSPAKSNESETKMTLEFGKRAKRIKNQFYELLPTEDNYNDLSGKIIILMRELARWQRGDKVPSAEQIKIADIKGASKLNLALKPSISVRAKTSGELAKMLAERLNLYKLLDDKVNEISQQSLHLEKEKAQLSKQPKATVTAQRANERIQDKISRIEKKFNSAKDEMVGVLKALKEIDKQIEKKKKKIS